jgi:hypothetical protein
MIVLTDSGHVMLSALPYPGHEVDREHWCELQKDPLDCATRAGRHP